jgi:hypothetical protein
VIAASLSERPMARSRLTGIGLNTAWANFPGTAEAVLPESFTGSLLSWIAKGFMRTGKKCAGPEQASGPAHFGLILFQA